MGTRRNRDGRNGDGLETLHFDDQTIDFCRKAFADRGPVAHDLARKIHPHGGRGRIEANDLSHF